MNRGDGSVSSCGGRDGGDVDFGRRGDWRNRCTAIVAFQRQMGHEIRWILILLRGTGSVVIVGNLLLLLGQFHGVMEMNGMDQLARNGVPEHILVFGDRPPIPALGMEFDGVASGILHEFGTCRPEFGSNLGRIFRSFGDGLDLDVAIDADPSSRFLLAGRCRLATAVQRQCAGVTS